MNDASGAVAATVTPDDSRQGGAATGPGRRFAVAVSVVVVVAVVVRLAYILVDRQNVPVGGDAFYYHQGANLLVDGEGFIHPFGPMDGIYVQAAEHPPLYILYLAAFSLVGARSELDHLLATGLLGVLSVVVAAFVGRRVGGERVGVVAAAVVALYPNVWRYDGMVMSEAMVVLIVLVIVWAAYWFVDRPTPYRLVVLAVTVGLGILTRSELLLLGPFLIVPVVFMVRDRSWTWRVGWVAGAGAIVVAVISPWLAYNHARFEQPVLLSSNLGGTLAVSYCETVFDGPLLGYWDFNCGPALLDEAGVFGLGNPQVDPTLRAGGLAFLRDNVDRLPKVALARFGRIIGVYEPTQQRDLDVFMEGSSRSVATAGMLTLPFALVAATGGAVVLRRRRVPSWPLLAPIGCTVLTVIAFYAATRFRATAEGPISVLAAVGLVALWDLLRRGARPPDSDRDGADGTRSRPTPKAFDAPSGG